MKTKKSGKVRRTVSLHRTYHGVGGEPVLYVGESGKVRELKGAKARSFLDGLDDTVTLISTSGHSTEPVLLLLADRGVKILTFNWHKSGIERGQGPEAIAASASLLDPASLYPFYPRPDLVDLRQRVMVRRAVLEYRKAVNNQFGAIERGAAGAPGADVLEQIATQKKAMVSDEKRIDKGYRDLDESGEVLEQDEGLARIAKKIPDCEAFVRAFGMKEGWIMAAQFVAFVGDVRRFAMFSSLMKFCGQHTVDEHAPKRRKGHPVDWSPRARTVLWVTIDACLKNNVPAVREPYERYRAVELARHDDAHPGCETKIGHCGAMARRKVTKLLLKKFYNLAGGCGRGRIGDNVPGRALKASA